MTPVEKYFANLCDQELVKTYRDGNECLRGLQQDTDIARIVRTNLSKIAGELDRRGVIEY